MKKGKTVISYYVCPECGAEFTIPRKMGEMSEPKYPDNDDCTFSFLMGLLTNFVQYIKMEYV